MKPISATNWYEGLDQAWTISLSAQLPEYSNFTTPVEAARRFAHAWLCAGCPKIMATGSRQQVARVVSRLERARRQFNGIADLRLPLGLVVAALPACHAVVIHHAGPNVSQAQIRNALAQLTPSPHLRGSVLGVFSPEHEVIQVAKTSPEKLYEIDAEHLTASLNELRESFWNKPTWVQELLHTIAAVE